MKDMKPEPLKNKLISCCGENNECGFSEKDVKSAVEWLKQEFKNLKKYNIKCLRGISPMMKKVILKMIDVAFEDVI